MPAPTPARKIIDLYNDLCRTEPSDKETIGKILWQIRQVDHKSVFDFRTKVALLVGHVMNGDRDEAIAVVEHLHGAYQSADLEPLLTYFGILVGLMEYERARDISSFVLRQPAAAGNTFAIDASAKCAFGSGDLEWLDELCGLETRHGLRPFSCYLSKAVKKNELREYFTSHQEIVRSVLRPITCFTTHDVIYEDDATVLVTYSYVSVDRDECKKIEISLTDELKKYYSSKGLTPGAFLPHFVNVISPVTAGGRMVPHVSVA